MNIRIKYNTVFPILWVRYVVKKNLVGHEINLITSILPRIKLKRKG